MVRLPFQLVFFQTGTSSVDANQLFLGISHCPNSHLPSALVLFGERFDFLLFSVSFCQCCFLCLTVRLFWTVLNFFCRRILSGRNVQEELSVGTVRLVGCTSGWLCGTHSRVPLVTLEAPFLIFPDLLCMSFKAHGASHAISMVHQWWTDPLLVNKSFTKLMSKSNWWRSQFTDQRQSARFSKIRHLCRISSTQSISSTGFEFFELFELFEVSPNSETKAIAKKSNCKWLWFELP